MSTEPGWVGIISHSVSLCDLIRHMAPPKGLCLSKVMTLGEKGDLRIADQLCDLAHDPATGLIGLFPALIPSRLDPASSLTIFNSSSSQYTLRLMAIVALVFVPIVVAYQFLVYRFFRSKTTRKEVESADSGY